MEYFYYSSLYLTYALLFITSLLGILKNKLLQKKEIWYLFYILFILIIEIVTNSLIEIFHSKNTAFLYPIYISGSFLLLTSLFIKKFELSKFWFIPIIIFTFLFSIGDQCFEYFNNDYSKVFSNMVIICLAGYSLLQEIKNVQNNNRFLWVDAFIFMYYSISVFTFILQQQLSLFSLQNASLIWGINNILTCLLYISFINTFLKLKK